MEKGIAISGADGGRGSMGGLGVWGSEGVWYKGRRERYRWRGKELKFVIVSPARHFDSLRRGGQESGGGGGVTTDLTADLVMGGLLFSRIQYEN